MPIIHHAHHTTCTPYPSYYYAGKCGDNGEVLIVALSSMMSATLRNINEAVKALPAEAQKRITVYDRYSLLLARSSNGPLTVIDSGYLGPHSMMYSHCTRTVLIVATLARTP
jgi:hypothetical protein